MNFNEIIHPLTNEKINIFSLDGKKLLKEYIIQYNLQKGGFGFFSKSKKGEYYDYDDDSDSDDESDRKTTSWYQKFFGKKYGDEDDDEYYSDYDSDYDDDDKNTSWYQNLYEKFFGKKDDDEYDTGKNKPLSRVSGFFDDKFKEMMTKAEDEDEAAEPKATATTATEAEDKPKIIEDDDYELKKYIEKIEKYHESTKDPYFRDTMLYKKKIINAKRDMFIRIHEKIQDNIKYNDKLIFTEAEKSLIKEYWTRIKDKRVVNKKGEIILNDDDIKIIRKQKWFDGLWLN